MNFKTIALITVLSSLVSQPDKNWTKIRESDGILTYKKSDGSSILEVKGVVITKARMDIVGNIFRNIPMHAKWVNYCQSAEVLKEKGQNYYVFYEKLQPPWPVSKRDIIAIGKSKYLNNNLIVSISTTADPTYMPEKKDYVRIKELYANISIEFVPPQRTGITYELKLDPGGSIPPFINNIFNQAYIFENMQKLRRISVDPKYHVQLANPADVKLIDRLTSDDNILKNTLKNRLSRYISSEENTDFLTNDNDFFLKWKENADKLGEMLFLGKHEEKYKHLAIKAICQTYLRLHKDELKISNSQISRLLHKPEVIKIFTEQSIAKDLTQDFIKQELGIK